MKTSKVMPKIAEMVTCSNLKKIITNHQKQSEIHEQKLENIFLAFKEKPIMKECLAIKGVLKEADAMIASYKDSPAINAAVISSLQKVEHYEIAAYESLYAWAKVLSNHEAATTLQHLLEEEEETNAMFIELANSKSNKEALGVTGMKGQNSLSKDGDRVSLQEL
jgi:ferritin-like metal-binding protein YciE